MADAQGFLSSGNADVEETAFFVEGSLILAAGVGQETVFHSHDVDMRKLKTLGGVHGDEGHLVSGRVLLFLAFLIQGYPRQKLIEPVHGLAEKLRDGVGQEWSARSWGGCHVREQSLGIVLQVHGFGSLLGGCLLALLATGRGG